MDPCDILRWFGPLGAPCVVARISEAVKDLNPMEMLAAYVMEAVASALASIGTMWVNVPSPNLRAGDEAADEAAVKAAVEAAESAAVGEPAGMSELRTILSYAQWIGYVLAAIALVGLGVRIAWKTRRGEGSGLAERASLIMGGTVLVGAATGLTSGFLADRPEGASSAIVFLQSALWQPALILVALSVIGGAVTMIWQQRADPGKQTLKGILEFILLSGAGVAAVQILLNMGDEFAPWIIDAALGGDCGGVSVRDPGGGSCFSENLLAWSTVTSKLSGPATPVVLIILLGLILLICSLIQICMMVIRGGMLIVLAGMLPIAAAGFGFEWGRGWLRRFLGWLGAAIAYKPAAAIIYAAGFKLAGTNPWGDDGIWQIVYGVAILLVALFALPALMKLFAPPTSAAAGGGGGGGTAALVAAGAGLAASFGGRGGGSPSGSDQNSATPQGNTAPATPSGADSAGSGGSGQAAGGGAASGGSGEAAGGGAAGGGAAGGGAAGGGAAGGAVGGGAAGAAGGAAGAAGGAAGAAGGAAGAAGGAATGGVSLAVQAAAQVVGAGVSAARGAVEDASQGG